MHATSPPWPTGSGASPLRVVAVLLAAGLIVAATPFRTHSDVEGRPRYSEQEIRRAIVFYAKRYRLDPALLRAVIKVESDFRLDVVSRKGAVGLMQLMPETAATLRVVDINDPIQNIRGGAKQLRHLLRLYEGDVPLALAAYNAGVHRVKEGEDSPNPRNPVLCEEGLVVLQGLSGFEARPKGASQNTPLGPCLHNQCAKALALGEANAGELDAELLAVDPPHNPLIDS
jgi:hypothetical protein